MMIAIIIVVIMSIMIMLGVNALTVVADTENRPQTIDQRPSLGRAQGVEIPLSPAYGGQSVDAGNAEKRPIGLSAVE